MSPTPELTAEQQWYLDSLLDHSEEELLLEITKGLLSGITASAKPRPQPTAQSREAYRNRVPRQPVNKYEKPVLEPFVKHAHDTVDSARARLYSLLCDAATLKPTQQAIEALTGTEKEVIAGVVGILFARYNEIMAVAIPTAVLLLKKGLTMYCAAKPAV